MTFAQLEAFSTVARLGSVKAAALALGVSEAAVSQAVGALRRDLGDDLFVRSGSGIALTPGGARLAAMAAEMVGLEDRARREVREARGEGALLRVAVTSDVSEHAAGPLIEAFAARSHDTEVAVSVEDAASFGTLLADRRADVALGPRAAADPALGIESIPFFRCRLVIVAHPRHPLAARRGMPPAALAAERWLVGPSGASPTTAVGAFLARHRLAPPEIRAYASHAAAVAAAEVGEGVTLVIAHTVLEELRRRSLVRLDVRGTPAEALWHCSTLGRDRRTAAAWALRRFVTTPEATQAILARSRGVPAGRYRPAVHVTLWS